MPFLTRHDPRLIQLAKTLFRYSGIRHLLKPVFAGEGVVFMLHRVLPASNGPRLSANSRLEVTPEFLDAVIDFIIDAGYEVISLDELYERLLQGSAGQPFACFTFDDGYADIYEHIQPLFKRRNLPFAAYISTSYIDKTMVMWHYMLEKLILEEEEIRFTFQGMKHTSRTSTRQEKESVYEGLRDTIMDLPREEYSELFDSLFTAHGIHAKDFDSQTLNWDQVIELSKDPLVTLGAHTVNHFNLAQLDEERVREEIVQSRQQLEERIKQPVKHFSYPFGKRSAAGPREFRIAAECGFRTMTTTREGNIFLQHKYHLNCLPRIDISGRYQDLTILEMRLNGLFSLARNGLQRVVTL